jgi:hypothetical protein
MIGALAMPAVAADTKGTLAIVNGVPGTKVDVCLNGMEVRSRLPYGGKLFQNDTSTGRKKVAKDVVFDNAGLGEIPPRGTALPRAPVAFRSAADLAGDITYHFWTIASRKGVLPSGGAMTAGSTAAGPT